MSELVGNMGCLPRSTKVGERFNVLADAWLIPRNEWQDISWRAVCGPILDQDGTNECCPHAAVAALHLIRRGCGRPDVVFSPAWLYRWINGGRDAGAAIDDAINTLVERGALPADQYPMLDWRKPEPTNWERTAHLHRASEWNDCPTFEHIASAILRGWPVCFGVFWSGGGGHALCGIGLKAAGNVWRIEIQNSWGTGWQEGGFGYLPESQVTRGISSFGAWALREATSDDGGPVAPHAA